MLYIHQKGFIPNTEPNIKQYLLTFTRKDSSQIYKKTLKICTYIHKEGFIPNIEANIKQ